MSENEDEEKLEYDEESSLDSNIGSETEEKKDSDSEYINYWKSRQKKEVKLGSQPEYSMVEVQIEGFKE